MLLFCRYGVDPTDATRGYVLYHPDAGQSAEPDLYPDCIPVEWPGEIRDLGLFGPEPMEGFPDDRHPAAPPLTVDLQRAAKVMQLKAMCGCALVAGFVSSALGSANVYPSAEEDQRNLSAALGASLVGGKAAGWTAPLKCAPAGQRAVRQPHTAAQVHDVMSAWADFLAAQTAKLDALKAKVATADGKALSGIAWA